MKTKSIKNKKMKPLFIMDILVAIICIIRYKLLFGDFSIIGSYISLIELFLKSGTSYIESIGIILLTILVLIFNIILSNYVIIAIYLGFRIIRGRRIKKNRKFVAYQNIDYYRNIFNDITPTDISILTDLELETKKDIAASILNLHLKKVIEFDSNKIVVNDFSNMHLKYTEIKLTKMLKENDFSNDTIETWRNLCINETINKDLVHKVFDNEKKVDKVKILKRIARLIFLGSLVATFIFTTRQDYDNYWENLDKKIDYLIEIEEKENKSEIELALNDSEYGKIYVELLCESLPIFGIGIGYILSINALIALTIYKISKSRVEKNLDAYKLERTEKGNMLVEQISGMKNFIHDFSILSQRDKEEILLWKEYLVYAIVLEENDDIIRDICKFLNIDNIMVKINDILNFK